MTISCYAIIDPFPINRVSPPSPSPLVYTDYIKDIIYTKRIIELASFVATEIIPSQFLNLEALLD